MVKEDLSAKKLIKQSWIGQTERYEIASEYSLTSLLILYH